MSDSHHALCRRCPRASLLTVSSDPTLFHRPGIAGSTEIMSPRGALLQGCGPLAEKKCGTPSNGSLLPSKFCSTEFGVSPIPLFRSRQICRGPAHDPCIAHSRPHYVFQTRYGHLWPHNFLATLRTVAPSCNLDIWALDYTPRLEPSLAPSVSLHRPTFSSRISPRQCSKGDGANEECSSGVCPL